MNVKLNLKASTKKYAGITAVVALGILFIGVVLLGTETQTEDTTQDQAIEEASNARKDSERIKLMNEKTRELLDRLEAMKRELKRRRSMKRRASRVPVAVTADANIVRSILPAKGDDYWIPLGTTILVSTFNRILSSNVETPVVAELPYTMKLDEYKIIEKGSRFIGTSTANYDLKRVFVNFHHMVTPDHKEVEIEAIGLDPFGAGGLSGTYHSNDLERLLAIFGLNLAAATADISQDQRTAQFGIPFRRLTVRNILMDGASKTFRQESERLLAEYAGHEDETIEVEGRSYMKVFFKKGFMAHATSG